ncbi:MAG: hypothetical protein PF445_10965 [Melioribacteraceae bacterium]|jgi:hypothetical protein|nr:hypothetical protein [Melioribacteraceae bacterium]
MKDKLTETDKELNIEYSDLIIFIESKISTNDFEFIDALNGCVELVKSITDNYKKLAEYNKHFKLRTLRED